MRPRTMERDRSRRPLRQRLVLFLLGSLLTCPWWLGPQYAPGQIAADQAYTMAKDSLDRSELRAVSVFGVLSVLKTGLAVVEGSAIVGFEIGDLVQGPYDTVDFAWRLAVVAICGLEVERLLLAVNRWRGADLLVGVSLLLLAMGPRRDGWTRLVAPAVAVGLLARFGVPCVIIATGAASAVLTSEVLQEAADEISDVEVPGADRAGLRALSSDGGGVLARLGHATRALITLGAVFVLDGVLLPLLGFWGVWRVGGRLVDWLARPPLRG